YPRMVAYTDVHGWHHKQFLGRGEFTLEFGDFEVHITVPSDHVVAATGVLQNPDKVLTATQRKRLERAKKASKPVFVVTPKEAKANEKTRAKGKKTWIFKAENVRDFAFASSRKFIWDAQGHRSGQQPVLAMSFYPNEAEALWSRYSTPSIVHTMNVYSRYTFEYPYPVAISVNGAIGGMEYPMISFNRPRPKDDNTYFGKPKKGWQWEFSKYGLISVIIHEVGHNYFPMIVNSDERQWTWMDEGLNTFLQFLAEQEWEEDYPSRRGFPEDIVEFMTSKWQRPIMTNSESLRQFGNNAYAKPATALNILRETIMGRELFDFAFREYARSWQFKRPMPADFFRIMEDASGIDLDWFWRGWFYSIDHVDIAIGEVRQYRLETRNPDIDKPIDKRERDSELETITELRNRKMPRFVQKVESLKDFYNTYDELDVTPQDREDFKKYLKSLSKKERKLLGTQRFFYEVDLHNKGGLVMPVIMQLKYEDGSRELRRFPAEIWKLDASRVSKLLMTKKPLKSILLDPHRETADADVENNYFPRRFVKSKFQLYKE
ncbi:MAG: M1 family metallopeptidase, partial [Myxococcota bacterium]